MKAAGHWLCAVGTKNKTKAIDRNLSSTNKTPPGMERVSKKARGGREGEK